MAIVKTTDTDTELVLTINNGDLTALNEVKKKWKFKSVEDILRYALAVMKKSEQNKVYIDENGTKIGYLPADSMLEKEEETPTSTS